jgi:hypothetical protein
LSLLYLKASEIISHTKSKNLVAFSIFIARPFWSKIYVLSSIKQRGVSVVLAKPKIGLVRVPWIQFGPLVEVRIKLYDEAR